MIAGLVVVAAAVFYLSGGYEKWRDDSALTDACGGMLPSQEVREFLKDTSQTNARDTGSDATDDQLGKCTVSGGGAETGLLIEAHKGPAYEGQAEAIKHRFLDDPLVMAVPLGNGWRGSVTYDYDSLYGSVELPCRKAGHKNESVVASVQSSEADAELSASAERRTVFARVVTEFARSVAEKSNCGARSVGGRVKSLAENPLPEERAVREASGTCTAVGKMGDRARKLGLTDVQEAPSDATTVAEDCYMLHDGDEAYRLTALYGGYAKSAHPAVSDSGIRADAEASCRNSPYRALYTLSLVQNGSWEPDGQDVKQFEREVLRAFAEQSAKRHGCTAVRVY
jgi:hypothetical protein